MFCLTGQTADVVQQVSGEVATYRARTKLAIAAGRAASGASRLLGRGGGNVIAGHVARRLDPQILRRLGAWRDVVTVTGTNGKTTTTAMLRAALAERSPVASNVDGANMVSGLVS